MHFMLHEISLSQTGNRRLANKLPAPVGQVVRLREEKGAAAASLQLFKKLHW